MDKIQRATEIHSTMTPHQMALRIVDMDDACAIAANRITELQDALELAEEAVRAKQYANHAVPEGWQLVPVYPTSEMLDATNEHIWGRDTDQNDMLFAYRAMLAAAPKLGGE